MSCIFRKFVFISLSLTAMLALYACGTSTNNDQGRSFLAIGFLDSAGNSTTNLVTPAFTDNATLGETVGSTLGDGRSIFASLLVQNLLSEQFLRVTRIDCTYQIPGASPLLSIPNESFGVTATLGEGNPAGDVNNLDTGLPSTFQIQFQLISPALFAFLNVNQNLIPALPYRMIVACTATGIADSGEIYVSNQVSLSVTFIDIAEGADTGGQTPVVGAGEGGTPDTFDTAGAGATAS